MRKICLLCFMSIPKEVVINCNGLYLLHHGNNQIHVKMIASSIKVINTCKVFANYQFRSAMVILCLDLWYSSIST